MKRFQPPSFLSIALVVCVSSACAKHHELVLPESLTGADAAVPGPSAEGGGSSADTGGASGSAAPVPRAALDLGDCFAVECTASLADSATYGEIEATACDPGERARIEVQWMHEVPAVRECPEVGPCILSGLKLAPTDDGKLWLLAVAHDPDPARIAELGVWLALYDAGGQPIHEQMADVTGEDEQHQISYRSSMAVDGRGHLFLGMAKHTRTRNAGDLSDSHRGWITEYAASGERVREHLVTPNARSGPLLARAGSDAIAVGLREGEGGIALLGIDGMLRWTQSQVKTQEIMSLVADPLGRVTLSGRIDGDAAIERYDEAGNFTWHRLFDRAWPIAADPWGNLFRWGMPGMDTPLVPKVIEIHKLGNMGNPMWRTTIAASTQSYSPGDAIVGSRGEVLIAGSIRVTGAGGGQRAVIHELSADGSRCRYFEVDPAVSRSIDQLATSRTEGQLFFVSTKLSGPELGDVAISVGRLAH